MGKYRGRVIYTEETKQGIFTLVSGLTANKTPWLTILKKVRQSYPEYVGGIDAIKQIYTRLKDNYKSPKPPAKMQHVVIQVKHNDITDQLAAAIEPIIQSKAEERARSILSETVEFINSKIKEGQPTS